jgi:divalent metal cation (Fe/Co/Zn/Cd) transporter
MTSTTARAKLLRRGLYLSVTVVVWNVLEGIIAVTAGLLASSVALISFGIDSSVEVLSALVVTWRLWSELRHGDRSAAEALERRAARVTGTLLLVLSVYIVVDAGRRLLGFGAEAASSMVGMALTSASLIAMPILGWAKLRTAHGLNSASMRADSYETIACAWLSLSTLLGLALNACLGWSWADPVAALVIVPLVVREGLEAYAD